jgi:hypothetical protein
VTERANRPEVRNPILGLKEFQEFLALPAEDRGRFARLCYALSDACKANAARDYRRNKWWNFLYWKLTGVYARHIARALNSATADHREAA